MEECRIVETLLQKIDECVDLFLAQPEPRESRTARIGEERRQVLDFARTLATCKRGGTPGESLIRFGGAINAADLAIMADAIEEGCEQVNPDEW